MKLSLPKQKGLVMPDIAMCSNTQCPSHLKCYRFMANPSVHQSYMAFKPEPGKKKCDDFMQLKFEIKRHG
jgi:hypothetical protein